MIQINILRKIQLLTLIAVISSTSILVYVDSAFAWEPPSSSLDQVLDSCACQKSGNYCTLPELAWWNATHYIDNITCEYSDSGLSSLISNPPDTPGPGYAIFDSPYKQVKDGVPIQEIKCNEDLHLNYKAETFMPICLTADTESSLVGRGVIKMRILGPGDIINQENLCRQYPDVEQVQRSCLEYDSEDLKKIVHANTDCSIHWRLELYDMWSNSTYDYQSDPIYQECLKAYEIEEEFEELCIPRSQGVTMSRFMLNNSNYEMIYDSINCKWIPDYEEHEENSLMYNFDISYVPRVCTDEMIKYLIVKNTNMFTDEGFIYVDGQMDADIDPSRMTDCENELLEHRY